MKTLTNIRDSVTPSSATFAEENINNPFQKKEKMKMKTLTLILMLAIAGSSFAFAGDLRWKNGALYFENKVIGKLSGETTDGIAVASEKVVPLGDNTFKLVRTYKAKKDTDSARICFDYVHSEKAAWWMIPAVSYNGNQWGSGKEPKGAEENGVFRSYSFRRTPIPGCTYSESDRFAVAVWSDNPTLEPQHFSCCIMPEELQTTHRIILPEEEMPTNYYNFNKSKPGYRKTLRLKKNETATLTLYINVNPVEPNHTAYSLFLKKAWKLAEKTDIKIPDADTLWKYDISYPRDVLYSEIEDGDKKFCGFIMAFKPDYKGGYGPLFDGFSSGWVGRNISVGAALLGDYVKRKDEKSLKMGLDVLDSWCNYCVLPNGLLRMGFSGFQQLADGADVNNLASAAESFFMAADLVRQCGVERPEYEKTAYGICDFVMRDQQPDGQYARNWNAKGKAGLREGTVCAAMILPMTTAYRRSGNKSYLESAKKAIDYYVGEFLRDGYTTAGSLDTHCIDKESGQQLLDAAIPLYEATGEKKYLDYAVQLSYYISTWLWHYGGVYPPDDDLTMFSYNTFGATSVSVQHHCLDEWGLLLVPRWLKLAEYTGDKQWKEKAIAIWKNSCQSISDGTLTVHNTVRPMGVQSESFFMCNYWLGDWSHNHEQWRMNDWWVLWPGAMRLEVIRTLGEDIDVLYK
jgi:hypothetical protein